MTPELPFLAAGAVAVAAGTAKAGHFPPSGMSKAMFGILALVIVASASTGTKYDPLVAAVGVLFLSTSVMAAVPVFSKAQVKEPAPVKAKK